MSPETLNPYESPKTATKASTAIERQGFRPRSGPAMYIAFFALIGGAAGIPLLASERAIGLVTVVPGALFGGLVYRYAHAIGRSIQPQGHGDLATH